MAGSELTSTGAKNDSGAQFANELNMQVSCKPMSALARPTRATLVAM